jgi:hypothetical protein
MRQTIQRKWRRVSGWARFALWLAFGVMVESCAGRQDPNAAMRSLLDVVQAICPPEITVGECSFRVEKLLDMPNEMARKANAAELDGGAE